MYADSDVGGVDINSGYFFARVFDSAAPVKNQTSSKWVSRFRRYGCDSLIQTLLPDSLHDLGGFPQLTRKAQQ